MVDRRGGAGEIIDVVDFHVEGERHVVTQGFEPGFVQEMFDVSAPPGEVVVDAEHLVAQRQQTVAQMRANEASAAGDQNSL